MKKGSQQKEIIPIFPLPGIVFYPGTPLPLHIFEPRYQQMTFDALGNKRKIGMVLLKPDWEDNYFEKPEIFPIGCVGSIENEICHADGKYDFILAGLSRFRILKEVDGEPYRRAEIELLEEQNEQEIGEEPNANRDSLIDRYNEFISLIPDNNSLKKKLNWDQDQKLSLFVDRFAYRLDLSQEEKQSFLEEQDVLRRAEFIHSFLKTKIELVRISKIRNVTPDSVRWN